MTTKHRIRRAYRIELREKDHGPMHVHLTGRGVDVMIDLASVAVMQGSAPKVILAEALDWVRTNQQPLIEDWRKWHS